MVKIECSFGLSWFWLGTYVQDPLTSLVSMSLHGRIQSPCRDIELHRRPATLTDLAHRFQAKTTKVQINILHVVVTNKALLQIPQQQTTIPNNVVRFTEEKNQEARV